MALKLQLRGTTWWLRGTLITGEHVHESTGCKTESEAKKLLIKREADALDATLNGKVKNCTFDQAAGAYVASGKGSGEDAFINKLVGYFGDRTIRSITQSELDQAGRDLYPECQPATVNRQCHTVFSAIYSLAHRDGFCEHRQWARPQWDNGRFNGLVRREQKRRVGSFPVAFDHAARFVLAMSPAPAMVMTALFYTGMRPSELFALEADAVNVKKRWINLDWNNKTETPRGVPIHDVLVPMLAKLVERGGILFRTPRGEPYPVADEQKVSGQMSTSIDGARRRTGIKDISPYTARHSVSSELVTQGVHPYIKDQILGHARKDPSHTYTEVAQPALIEAINKLPVIPAWAAAPWMADPIGHAHKLAEGTGRRTDLEKLKLRREKRHAVNTRKKATERRRKSRAAEIEVQP